MVSADTSEQDTDMIEVRNLTKYFGSTTAVDDLSFSLQPGRITGFLGPNGAGKSTTMRIALGLQAPDSGSVLVRGHAYHDLEQPLRKAGALLDARGFHPGRSARNHLLGVARTHGIGLQRVTEVLEITGLQDVAHRSPGQFSLGMTQRLGLAEAMLGDPPVLLLDEPMNGLDAEGMNWMRRFLRTLADEGRTIFVSSHFMSEMANLADWLVVIGRGRLLAETTVQEFVAKAGGVRIRARTPDPVQLAGVLKPIAGTVTFDPDQGSVVATGVSLTDAGDTAARHGIVVYELGEEHPSLEDAFLRLTADHVEFAGRNA